MSFSPQRRRLARQASRPAVASSEEGQPAATNRRRGDETGAVRGCVHVGVPNHSLLERVSAIEKPVSVPNGDSDRMMLSRYSYLLAGLPPKARLTIYPDSAHGFLFQH